MLQSARELYYYILRGIVHIALAGLCTDALLYFTMAHAANWKMCESIAIIQNEASKISISHTKEKETKMDHLLAGSKTIIKVSALSADNLQFAEIQKIVNSQQKPAIVAAYNETEAFTLVFSPDKIHIFGQSGIAYRAKSPEAALEIISSKYAGTFRWGLYVALSYLLGIRNCQT